MNGGNLPTALFRAFSALLCSRKFSIQDRDKSSVSGRTDLQLDRLQLRGTKPLFQLRKISREVVRVLCHADLLMITRDVRYPDAAWLAAG